MAFLLRFVCLCLLLFPPAALAQGSPLAGVGLVFLHGKGGRPGGNIAGLASELQAQGAVVVTPSMAWSGTRGTVTAYDVTFEQALGEIDRAIAQLRAKGARKIVVAGHSLGANAAIAYAARKPNGLAGIMALAPGHTPERFRRSEILQSVGEARALVARGAGATRDIYPDLNSGQTSRVPGTAQAWLSFFDPDGSAVMPKNAARLSLPLLYVIGTSDMLHAEGRDYVFARAKPHPQSRYVEVRAGHFDTPDAAKADVIAWLRTL